MMVRLTVTHAFMTQRRNPWFLGFGLACTLLFTALLVVRTGLVSLGEKQRRPDEWPAASVVEPDERWMAILQDDRRIGTAHSRIEPLTQGYRVREAVRMRLNTMGLVQDLALDSGGWLNPDLTLDRFTFTLQSGRFTFAVRGQVEDGHLVCRVRSGGEENDLRLSLDGPLYLPAAIFPVLVQADATPGGQRIFTIFDPATMARERITATLAGRETITLAGGPVDAWKVRLSFKGVSQEAWLDNAGRVLMEKGLLGIRQERISREEALADTPVTAGGDLTRIAAVTPDRTLDDPVALSALTLQLSGLDLTRYDLHGGRQDWDGDRLTIVREPLSAFARRQPAPPLPQAADLLAPSVFVQSDHPEIRALAGRLTDPNTPPLVNLQRLVDWMQTNIARRPVVSVPNALDTLRNRMGDCNEYAVLLAALARAAGYPAQVEAGLVYLDGRFYYHAWNRVYIGRWITVDALFGQIPADVSHIRFVRGNAGEQLDLLPLIGNLQIRILGMKP